MTQPGPPHPDLNYDVADAASQRSRAGGPWNLEHLRLCWIVLLCAGSLLSVLAAIVGGERALWGSAVGTAIVGAFFSFSTLVVAAVGARAPRMVLAAALIAYVIKIVALGIVIVLLPPDGALSPRWMAVAVVVGLVGWMTAHLRFIWTSKLFYADPS